MTATNATNESENANIDLREHLSKLSVQPGDVLTLHLDESYEDMDEDQLARGRVKAELTIREACGFEDVRVLVVPPGAKLAKREPRHLGFLCVSRELLLDWLGMPTGSRLDSISEHARFLTNEIVLRIEHPALPAANEGQVMPQLEPNVIDGAVSTRIDWNHNGAMPGVPPTIRPDAAKLVALLQRVSAEFVRCGGDAGVHGEVVGAILELSGKELGPAANEELQAIERKFFARYADETPLPPVAGVSPVTAAKVSGQSVTRQVADAVCEQVRQAVPDVPVVVAGEKEITDGYFFAPGTRAKIVNEFRESLKEHVENADASIKAHCSRDVSEPSEPERKITFREFI